jgi:hypothetical protein
MALISFGEIRLNIGPLRNPDLEPLIVLPGRRAVEGVLAQLPSIHTPDEFCPDEQTGAAPGRP